MNKSVKNTWLGISIFGVLIGLTMILWPLTSQKIICYVSGIAAILFGILQFVLQWRIERKEAFSGRYILAALLIVVGILLLVRMDAVLALWGAALGILLLIDSLFKCRLAFFLKRTSSSHWKTTLIIAGAFALIGILMLFAPAEMGQVLIVLCGIGLVADCGTNIWLYLSSPKTPGGSSFNVK